MRRLMSGVVLVVLLVLVRPAPAVADVTVDKRSVAAGTEQELHFSVPDEYEGRWALVTVVEFHLPEGFALIECIPVEGWTCSVDLAKRKTEFHRPPRNVEDDGDDVHLGLRARVAPTAGHYPIQAVQWYKSGQVVRWDGPRGSARPAPVVRVTGSAPVVTTAPVETTSGTPSTLQGRGLISPKIRTRSTEVPIGAFVAFALLASVVLALWWRGRLLPRTRM